VIANQDLRVWRRFWNAFAPIWIALILSTFSFAQTHPEEGAFYYKQYLPEVYGGANPQNWAAVQDKRGVMYFGNTDGSLEYDGARWKKLRPRNEAGVRSLAVDENGTVYVGGQGEIGFLKPGANGTLAYASLVDQVPERDRAFSDVWTTFATNSGVLFGSYQRVFQFVPGHGVKVLRPRPKSRFGRLFVVDGTAYVTMSGWGLCRLVNDSFELIPGGELFAHLDARVVFSFHGTLMVGAADNTFYRATGKSFVRWVSEADASLKEFSIYTAAPLRNGDLAIGTLRGGLALISPTGNLVRWINKRSGLPSDQINSVFVANDGSVWCALGQGIVHLENELPLTRFGDREGIEEIVLSIQRHAGTLYVGTMTGVGRLVPSPQGVPRFEPIEGIQGQVFSLWAVGKRLIAGGQHGLYQIDHPPVKSLVSGDLINDVSASPTDSNLLYAAGRRAIYVLRSTADSYEVASQIPSEGHEFRTVLEDVDGRLWATRGAGIWRITLRHGEPVSIERFSEEDGVPGPAWRNNVYRVGTRIVFATPKGLFQFDREKNRFVGCDAFGAMFADGTHAVSIIKQSSAGEVWISGAGYHGILHPQGSGVYAWDENPLARSGIKEIYSLYLDPDNVAWASGSDGGLVRYQVWSTSVPSTDFSARLREVQTLRGNQLLYGGYGPASLAPAVKHQWNGLSFLFSAPAFEEEGRMEYQVRLDKLDHGWSEWGSETRKEYTNLYEGDYVFRVRARDLHGRISGEAMFGFRVLPPWFRTWWAYLLYAIGLVSAVSGIVKWRLHTLAEANRKLEEIIEERTEEIRQQRDTIQDEEQRTEALLLNILPESVAEELRSTGTVAPVGYDDITVCFTDFVGFTLASEGLPPAALVAALHKYFTAFDEIVGRYGLEKLKTIGDSYMFVSGLPNRSPSHAVDAVMAALEIADYVVSQEDIPPGWKIRIGIHSGPVVAGVVGVRKFAFDIWGETVNFASRFESSGVPNRVNISAQTFKLVREFIDCEPRGLVRIKEGRKLEMYLARSIRQELLDDSAAGMPSKFETFYHQRFGRNPHAIVSLAPREPLLVHGVAGD
jgi:class 3 adenylate cyclase